MRDLDAARRDVTAFADAIRCPLHDWQAAALALATRVTAIVAPRQSGKSRALVVLALWVAFVRPGVRVLVVSASEDAARRLLADVRRLATGSPLLRGSVVDEQAALVTLTNGSEVRSVPQSERAIRGWAVDLLLVDEAGADLRRLLLGAALPTTAARPDARIVLASSALTAAGAFYDHAVLGEQGSEHVRTFRWRLADADWISPSAVQAARESMSEARFLAEFERRFASGADALFDAVALDRATADYQPDVLAGMRGPAKVVAGVDWGQTNDRSALVAVGRLAVAQPVWGVRCSERWAAGTPLPRVVEDIAERHAAYAALVPRPLRRPVQARDAARL